MKMLSIASGSSGNCIYVGSRTTHLLLDAGISRKRIVQGLEEVDLTAAGLDGILITHEHADHINGLGVLLRKDPVPVYGTEKTLKEIQRTSTLGKLPEGIFHPVYPDREFEIGDMRICPFSVSHDAADPVAYRIRNGNHSLAVVTDLGMYTEYTVSHLRQLDAVLLEANHDVEMLMEGIYPYPLKKRILGDRGHLSNELAGGLLNEILHDGMKYIVLGHMSKENNYPQLVYDTVRHVISQGDTPYGGNDFPIIVAKRSEPSEVITLE